MLKLLMRSLVAALALLLAAPLAHAQSPYEIKPGDTLQLEVLEDPSLNRSLLVLPDGTVSVPLAGTLRAAGQSVDEIRGAIISALAPNFATQPSVYLSVGQLAPTTAGPSTGTRTAATISIFALGEVNNPGQVEVARGTTLLQFLAASGGLTNFAATKRIQLRRVDRTTKQDRIYLYNYNAVLSGSSAPTITLQAGDVIIVPQRRLFE